MNLIDCTDIQHGIVFTQMRHHLNRSNCILEQNKLTSNIVEGLRCTHTYSWTSVWSNFGSWLPF